MITGDRIDLNVPFAEKDRAKAQGARWDDGADWVVCAATAVADPKQFAVD